MIKILRRLRPKYRWLAISIHWYLNWWSTSITIPRRWVSEDLIIEAIGKCAMKSRTNDPRMITAVAGALAAFEAELVPAQEFSILVPFSGPDPKTVRRFRDNAVTDAADWYTRKVKIEPVRAWEEIYMQLDEWFPVPGLLEAEV